MIGRLGWGHNFDSKNERAGYFVSDPNPSYFRIETTPLDKNNVVYGLSAVMSVNDSVDLKLTYDGGASRNSVSHAGALTVVYNF
jgi:outer membrane autotransporter protein